MSGDDRKLKAGTTTERVETIATNGTRSFDHTTEGDDRFLVVFIHTGSTNGDYISYVTYGDQSLTKVFAYANPGGPYGVVSCYYLINPALGSNSLVVSSGIYNTGLHISATSFSGANQRRQLTTDDIQIKNYPNGDDEMTATITTPIMGCYLVGMTVQYYIGASTANFTAGSGTSALGAGATIYNHNMSQTFISTNPVHGRASASLKVSSAYESTRMLVALPVLPKESPFPQSLY